MFYISRRKFLKNNLPAAALLLLGPSALVRAGEKKSIQARDWKPEKKYGFSLGLASYTFRAFSLEQTIAMTLRLGLEKLALKDIHLPLDSSAAEIREASEKVRRAGLDLYGCGVVYLEKPEDVERAFSYARTAGLGMIIASPDPKLLPLISQKVRETGIFIAIHNHGPGDRFYPTPADAQARLKNLDPGVGLCLDIGHAVRAGVDPAEAARKFSGRLLDIHLKDVSEVGAGGQTVEIGRGVIDIKSFLKTIIEIEYRGVLSFEFEKDEKDPLPGVAESVGFVRGLLS
ncbi:MAG: sugar phosphate isomerase/epimerase [Candidatus Saccharicenans sp.]|nr:sugar phosphate isomerase/epimerase [Candidatus Saccharicenans sp.]